MLSVPSEPIVAFGCPECGGKLTVPAELLGVTGPCPLCHRQITAPQWSAPEIPLGAGPQPVDRERNPVAHRAKARVATVSDRQRPRIRPLNQRRESRLPAASVQPRERAVRQALEMEGTADPAWRLPIGCDIGSPPPITGKASSRREREISSPGHSANLPGMDPVEPRMRRRSSPEDTGGSGASRALLFAFALTVVGAGIPLIGVYYHRSTQVSAERAAPVQELPESVERQAVDRREVLKRLRAFHEAESAEAKAAFVLDESEKIDVMRPYYDQHALESTAYTVDPALEFFERDGVPAVRGRGLYGNREPFVFEFSKRGGEWLLDWNRFKGADRLADNVSPR